LFPSLVTLEPVDTGERERHRTEPCADMALRNRGPHQGLGPIGPRCESGPPRRWTRRQRCCWSALWQSRRCPGRRCWCCCCASTAGASRPPRTPPGCRRARGSPAPVWAFLAAPWLVCWMLISVPFLPTILVSAPCLPPSVISRALRLCSMNSRSASMASAKPALPAWRRPGPRCGAQALAAALGRADSPLAPTRLPVGEDHAVWVLRCVAALADTWPAELMQDAHAAAAPSRAVGAGHGCAGTPPAPALAAAWKVVPTPNRACLGLE